MMDATLRRAALCASLAAGVALSMVLYQRQARVAGSGAAA